MRQLYCQRGRLRIYVAFLLTPLYILCFSGSPYAQTLRKLEGLVKAAGSPLPGASVQIRSTGQGTTTNENGYFSFQVAADSARIVVSYIGYGSVDTLLFLPSTDIVEMVLLPDAALLEELAVTGYEQIPRERATGSFVQVDNALVNRSVTSNILDRLRGTVSGLAFQGEQLNASTTNPLGRNLGIRIRGESTLAGTLQVSRDPLIVVDNFPFEGNLNSINPNDIESVTILRDAAAAAIWGARAGNGVIVIVTKKGQCNQPMKVELTANVSILSKPNVFSDVNYLDAPNYLGVEQYLFEKGFFNSDIAGPASQPVVSPAVSIMAAQRSGKLSAAQAQQQLAELASQDVRLDFDKYVYRMAARQQYALSLSGGSGRATYRISTGYDHNAASVSGNRDERFTLSTENSFSPLKGFDVDLGVFYSALSGLDKNHQNQYGSVIPGGKYQDLYPYAQLADQSGQPLAVIKDYNPAFVSRAMAMGFQDWLYRPLAEAELGSRTNKTNSLRLRANARYSPKNWFNIQAHYQLETQSLQGELLNSAESYYSRNLVNRFTLIAPDSSLSYQVPLGGVNRISRVDYVSNNARLQAGINKIFGQHGINVLGGAEARELRTTGFERLSYGYDPQTGISANNLDFSRSLTTNPSGSSLIPAPDGAFQGVVNRFISYYVNGSYVYRQRYIVSASVRRDGANIFGAKTNDKITPLWSVGGAWELSSEKFYHLTWLPYLKFRGSYGSSGNVYQGSVYATGTYLNSGLTGLPYVNNIQAPNPQLRWETVKTTNVAIDFGSGSERLTGSVEFYIKKGLDLIQSMPLAPSTGFFAVTGNSAATTTRGMDLTLRSKNLTGKLGWQTVLLLSSLHDRVNKFNVTLASSSMQGQGGGRVGVKGNPLYALYSYHWNGVDSEGDPTGRLNGETSKDYVRIISNFQPDSLVFNGSAVPTWFGALRNDFSFGPWTLSVNLTYKMGYVFRRNSTSLNYSEVLAGRAHKDYLDRWQQAGDELNTQVPALVYPSNSQRNTFYQYSEALVERGDHIRLQDVRVGFDLGSLSRRLGSAELYFYGSNLGILWRANRLGQDPDYVSITTRHQLPAPASFALGVRASF